MKRKRKPKCSRHVTERASVIAGGMPHTSVSPSTWCDEPKTSHTKTFCVCTQMLGGRAEAPLEGILLLYHQPNFSFLASITHITLLFAGLS
jgi:hypothetical protein